MRPTLGANAAAGEQRREGLRLVAEFLQRLAHLVAVLGVELSRLRPGFARTCRLLPRTDTCAANVHPRVLMDL
jgi:hypothetical protein